MYSHVGHDLPLLLELLMPVVFTIVIVFCLGEPLGYWVASKSSTDSARRPNYGEKRKARQKRQQKDNKPLCAISRLHCQAVRPK
jgi:hypothetical protein